jgi:hypothetical protein
MSVATRFTNPRTTTRALLDEAMTVTVGTAFPSERPTNGYVQVGWDGTPITAYPATIRATVRVTAWHINPTPAEDLAMDVLSVLGGSAEGNGSLWAIHHLTGPLPGQDSDSGYWFAYSTFRVSPKPF